MVEVETIPEGVVKELIRDALNKSDREAFYILTLREYEEKAGSSTDYRKIDVVVGEVQKVILAEDNISNGSDYRRHKDIAIIPLTVPVIVQYSGEYNGWDKHREYLDYFIFTTEGWKRITVK